MSSGLKVTDNKSLPGEKNMYLLTKQAVTLSTLLSN